MRWLAALIVVAGCDDVFGLTFIPDAPPLDAVALTCYGRYGAGETGLFQFCTAALGTYPQLVDLTINTDIDPICAPNAAAACVVTSQVIDIVGTLRAVGSRPLVLVSASTIVVHGEIDVSSNGIASGAPSAIGAGTDPPDCVLAAPTMPSAGGSGGSFQTSGGAGGGGVPTSAAPPIAVTTVRGGCPGNSGVPGTNASQGFGGAGGGAVYLIAATSITIAGSIDASGSPGTGASAEMQAFEGGGGGGGGAGGLIGLDSPMITIAGAVIANGGGGGGGGGGLNHGGTTGGRASPTTPTTPAMGGAGGMNPEGCDGGTGFAGVTVAGDSESGSCVAGGGGGGGAGYVKVFGQTPQGTGMVSPAPD